MYDVVALGELLIDFTCQSVDPAGYPTMAAHPGGAPANFLAALAKFGARTALLGKVGSDAFGGLLRDTLRAAGIETRGLVAARDVFTTLSFVTLDEHGDRSFSFARKPGADTCLTFEELDLELIREAGIFHFGSLSLTDEPARTTTRRAVQYAKAHGKLITYDPNLRQPLWDSLDTAREQILWGLHRLTSSKSVRKKWNFCSALALNRAPGISYAILAPGWYLSPAAPTAAFSKIPQSGGTSRALAVSGRSTPPAPGTSSAAAPSGS